MKKNNILVAVIDDIESIRDSVKMTLENQQWGALTYTSGEDFLSDLKGHKPDCIILDSHLPGMSGAEVARSIASDATPIPIIVLTAYPNSSRTNEIRNMDIGTILIKPVSDRELIGHIQAAITFV